MVDLVQWSLFLLFSVLVLGGALWVFLTMSMYRAGVSLMLSLVAMAGLFILLEADMLAVIQVMMNIGGMLVMTLYMVMLMLDPGGEMMWDMKRRMKMKGFGALSMSMPPELPAEKPKVPGRALSPPPGLVASHTNEDKVEKEAGSSETQAGNEVKVAMVENMNNETMTNRPVGTSGSPTGGDPSRRMREMQRSIAIMQQQLGLLQQQMLELQEDLLVGLPESATTGNSSNNPVQAPSPSHQLDQANLAQSEQTPATIYTCPMHPQIRQTKPGRCPICGMDLVPVETPEASTQPQSDTSSKAPAGSGASKPMYTCPMHPEVRQPGPGRCPKCGMDLVPEEGGGDEGSGQGSTGHSSAGGMGAQPGHDHGHMAPSSSMSGGGVETAEQMQKRSPKAYYRMMADMAMSTRQLPLAGLFSLLAGLLLVVLVLLVAWPARPTAPDLDGPSGVGDLLLSNYMIAFEGAAVLILAGILGAVLLARRERKKPGPAGRKPFAGSNHKQEVH